MSDLDAYDYELPRELIAQFPLVHRADARLLLVNRAEQTLQHHHIRDLPDLLGRGDMLVLNDTRVLPARLTGRREQTGGRWSGLFLSEQDGLWEVMCKTRGNPQPGEWIVLEDRDSREGLRLQLVAALGRGLWTVRPAIAGPAAELLQRVGRVPLPPYIRGGHMVDADEQTYQTVFAERFGAVAAPTAGLHFTPSLLKQLASRGVDFQRVTLHVGAGTFQPISTDRLDEHQMHAEWAELSAETADAVRQHRQSGGRVIAVGTTVVRTLESASRSGDLQAFSDWTDLFIKPPYSFQSLDGLLTNFHVPKSTLLILVRAFGGDALIERAYQEAIDERYRFFSYGDAMLIL